jgi:hypothetical protein
MNCSSFIPLARQRLLAPAMFLPEVVFALLSWIFILVFYIKKKLPGSPESFVYIYNTYYSRVICSWQK